MTWIIGVNTFMGYSFALSDIKVSWGKKYDIDCLQKFYPITSNIAAGFAGSVKLGFKMLDGLVDCIKNEGNQKAFIPIYIAQKWSRKAKYIYNHKKYKKERGLGCELLMIGTYPLSQITIGQISSPKTALIKLSAPSFVPLVAKQHDILSIGSGSAIDEYKALLAWLDSNFNELMKFSENVGLPAAFDILVTDLLQNNPKYGISKHLHIITADGIGINIRTNDRQADDGSYVLKMPEVAVGYDQFREFCKKKGLRAKAAIT